MKKTKILIVIVFLMNIFNSCEESANINEEITLKNKKGTVKFLDEESTDGCGWIITTDSINLKPVSLNNSFKIKDLPIIIDYKFTSDTFQCGFSATPLREVIISNIKIDSAALNIERDKKAKVQYLGDISSDGCGWIINIDSVDYKPTELSVDYQIENLPIIIDFKTINDKERCGFSSVIHNKISIIKIEIDTTLLTKGVVQFEGEPSADGCGWLLEINEEYYKPVNLPEDFKTDNLSVFIMYSKTNESYRCGFSSVLYDEIDVLYISIV